MKLFHVILKLIETLTLVSTQEHAQLTADVKEWEVKAMDVNNTEVVSTYYRKIHEGVYFRLITPFLYFFALREVRKIMSPEDGNDVFVD